VTLGTRPPVVIDLGHRFLRVERCSLHNSNRRHENTIQILGTPLWMQMGPDPAAACDYFRRQLKALCQRLLHGMRIEHIARTLYDSSNVSIILVKNETEVIGGAPYSPWDDWGYAEAVLMGIASTYQRRGFDGRALARLKRFVANWHPLLGWQFQCLSQIVVERKYCKRLSLMRRW